jgi:hypothetical protein
MFGGQSQMADAEPRLKALFTNKPIRWTPLFRMGGPRINTGGHE